MRRKMTVSLLAAAALLAPAAAVALPTTAAYAASSPVASFTKGSDWGTGYEGKYTISNAGSAPLNGWTLEFDLPANHNLAGLWDGVATTSGRHVTVRNPGWAGPLPVGGSASFGFNVSYSGPYQPLTGCLLNGKACDGSGDGGDTQAPTVPGQLRSTGSTTTTVSLAWDASTDNVGVTGYEVYQGGSRVATVTGTTATVAGLTADTAYSFTVQAVDAAGNHSAAAGPVSVRTQRTDEVDTVAPSKPGRPTAGTVTSSTVALSWTPSTDNVGVTAYDVYAGAAKVATSAGASTTVTGLNPDTAYSFTVRARDAAGNASAASDAAEVRTAKGGGGAGDKRVAYFTQWSIYSRGYSVKQVDTSGAASRLTHLNYAFANIHPTDRTCFITNKAAGSENDPNAGDGAGDAWADFQKGWDAGNSVAGTTDTWDQPLKGNFNQLKQLKAKYPNLKVQISLGGWSYSKWFSDAALTDASRKKLVSSCIDMYIKGNLPLLDGVGGPGSAAGVFDGIDLDWEWPGSGGHVGNVIRPEDKHNFTLLVQEFRRQLDALSGTTGKHYDLTAFLPADPAKIQAGMEIGPLFDAFDFATVQGYDYHGAWEARANQQSALKLPAGDPSEFTFSSEIAVNAYVAGGAARSKLVLGVPFYGRGWTGVPNGGTNGLFQTSTGPAPGSYEAGFEDYKKLKTMANGGGYTVYRDTAAGHAWIYNGSTFYTYDDAVEITRKAGWITSQSLGGAMVWSLDGDTADGELIKALDSGLK